MHLAAHISLLASREHEFKRVKNRGKHCKLEFKFKSLDALNAMFRPGQKRLITIQKSQSVSIREPIVLTKEV